MTRGELVIVTVLGVFAAVVFLLLCSVLYFTVSCYVSGNPDSMACYMVNGKTQRVNAHIDGLAK